MILGQCFSLCLWGINHCEKILVLLRVGVRWLLKIYSFTFGTVFRESFPYTKKDLLKFQILIFEEEKKNNVKVTLAPYLS